MIPLDPDYYAVLQVHPDAEREVIDAAYRQLMRKYHPDVAGDDPDAGERAKQINKAYAVLRDPHQRCIYDSMRLTGGTWPPPPPTPPPPPPRSTPPWTAAEAAWRAASQPPEAVAQAIEVVAEPWYWRAVAAPWVALTSLYYLLPGPYEWDPGGRRELVQACAVPPLGVACWMAATGRFDALLGDSLFAVAGVWAVLGLVAVLTVGSALPRLAVAGGLTLLLVNGTFDEVLQSARVPLAMAWVGISLVSLLLAARSYVFGILPTIALCWLLARLS